MDAEEQNIAWMNLSLDSILRGSFIRPTKNFVVDFKNVGHFGLVETKFWKNSEVQNEINLSLD